MSEKPLLTDREAAAIAFTGAYRGGDAEAPQDMILAADGANSYEMSNGKEDRIPARFIPLRGDWYLMQGEGHSDEEGTPSFYLYQLLRVTNGDLYFYSPSCEEISGTFKGLKREKGEVETCNFSRLDGLKAMASTWMAKFERGDIPDEPEVFTRVPAAP